MPRALRIFTFFFFSLTVILMGGCQTGKPLPSADLNQPGWTVRQGQAIWRPKKQAPELVGELFLATHLGGQTVIQFSKSPFPLVVGQTSSNRWQIEFVPQSRRFRGPGKPPRRIIWLYLAAILDQNAKPPSGWKFQKMENDRWLLENGSTGERLEGYLSP